MTDYSMVPWYRKWINVGIIWLLIMPVGVILMWSGEVYRNKKNENGELIVMSKVQKIMLTAVMVLFIFRAFSQ